MTPPGPVISGDGVLTVDAVNTRTVRNITVLAGVTLDNSEGTLVGATNAGTIVGGTLSGVIANGGLISGTLILEEGAEIRGGTVTGVLSGMGTGAVLVQALVDGAVLNNVRIEAECVLTLPAVFLNPGLDITGAVTSAGGRHRSRGRIPSGTEWESLFAGGSHRRSDRGNDSGNQPGVAGRCRFGSAHHFSRVTAQPHGSCKNRADHRR